jgi:Questin oxidase-like
MTLRQLLDQSLRLDAEYRRNLASHLPMALTALARLGAADARLADFANCYAKRLHPAPPPEPWPAGEPWKGRFGDPRAWPAYRSLFNEWIDDEGAPAVLAQALPALIGGVGAAAFHGPIRTAYAIAAGHSHELADALAYWACRWFALGVSPTEGRARDAAIVLARLNIAKPRQPLIAERMAQVAEQPGFAGIAAAFCVDDPDATLAQLAALAARLYAASGNFTVLHLVTSAHALRVLLPWLDVDERSQAVGLYWLAYAAGHAASGLTRHASAAAPVALRPWPEIVSQAIASDDDHFIKLVDSCREQERAYGGEVWHEAASRALQSA